jgi:hypothetical protein
MYCTTRYQWRRRGCSTLVCLINPPLTEGFSKMNWLPGGMRRGVPGLQVARVQKKGPIWNSNPGPPPPSRPSGLMTMTPPRIGI